jgi:nucleoside-diphosphate-sugar epimerase
LPLVLVEDVARGLVAAMNADGAEGQSFNLVADPCLSAREYLQEIERFAGISIRAFHQPVWSAFGTDVCKWLAKMALRMPDRCVPRYRVWRSRTARAVFDCSKAKEVLGWQPTCDRDSLVARGIHVHLIDAIQVGRPGSDVYAPAERPELDHVAQ